MLRRLVEILFPYSISEGRYIDVYSDESYGDIRLSGVKLVEIDRRKKEDFAYVKELRLRPGMHSFRLQMTAEKELGPSAAYTRILSLTSLSAAFYITQRGSYVLSAMFRDERGSVFTVQLMRNIMFKALYENSDLLSKQYEFVPIMYPLPGKKSPSPCSVCGKLLPYAGNVSLESQTGILQTDRNRTTHTEDAHDRWEGYICDRCKKIFCGNCASSRFYMDGNLPPAEWAKCKCGNTLFLAERKHFRF